MYTVFHWQMFATNLSKSVNSIGGFFQWTNRIDGLLPICSKNLPMENGKEKKRFKYAVDGVVQ